MHRYRLPWKSHSNHFFVAVLASSTIFTVGCANMGTTAAVSNSLTSSSAAVSGHVHGGNQPIAFATVTVNFAGTTNGGVSTVVATTTTADDGAGSFSFIKAADGTTSLPPTGNSYACPASASQDPLVYIKAVGGNTQNSHDSNINNTASVFLAPLGRCKEINTSTFLNITEVTTVASIAALQQYFDPVLGDIGADAIGVETTALSNSFNLINSLVSISGGNAVTSTTFNGGGLHLDNGVSATTAVTATPESQKINTIANIIAACVNSASASAAPCQTLFTNAVPPDYSVTAKPQPGGPFPPATDVLQAAYYMMTNPTANVSNLYNLPVGIGAPFQPALTDVPNDWTIAISYSSSSPCVAQATTPVIPASSGGLISSPAALNIDNNGDVWIANNQLNSGNLTEISATGTPVVCAAMNAPTTAGQTVSTTIDQSSTGFNVWQGSSNSLTLSRYNPITLATVKFTVTEAPIALAADGLGNVYFSTALGNLYQLPGAANATATQAATLVPIQISTNPNFVPTGLFIDNVTSSPSTKSGAIWMTSGAGHISRTVPNAAVSDPGYQNGFSTTVFTTTSPSYALTVGPSVAGVNNVYFSLPGATASEGNFTGSGTSYATVPSWPPTAGFAGFNNPTGIALDGRGNSWLANNSNTGTTGSVSEVSAAQAALSSSSGFLKPANYLSNSRSIIIDQSGNVWVGGDGNNFITEIVGAAVPVYQPYAAALFVDGGSRFQQMP